MTPEDIKNVIESLKRQGLTEEMIAKCFVNLFIEDKINIEQCDAMLSFLGYHIPDEVKAASPKTQKKIAKQLFNE